MVACCRLVVLVAQYREAERHEEDKDAVVVEDFAEKITSDEFVAPAFTEEKVIPTEDPKPEGEDDEEDDEEEEDEDEE